MGDSAEDEAKPPAAALAMILGELDSYVAEPARAEAAALGSELSTDVLAQVATVEALRKPYSYRDGLLIQLAFGFALGDGFDHTHRTESGRTVSGQLGRAFADRHVPGVMDAYQNIGKNFTNLARGNVPAFDDLLRWMNGAPRGEREALFRVIAARAALTARPVAAMPTLRPAALSFGAVVAALDELLSIPSGGAFEQFTVAAFLEALLDEFGLTGVGQLHVRTKNINASDASSGTAADVQVMRGNKVEEAFEVSANDWRTKLAQAIDAARNADLNRVHVIAAVPANDDLSELARAPVDVSVIDVRAFVRSLVGAMRKPSREVALRRLYELIDRNQPDAARVNAYVELLRRHALTAD